MKFPPEFVRGPKPDEKEEYLFPGALCLACGVGELEFRYSDQDYKYVVVKDVPTYFCPTCMESFTPNPARQKVNEILATARKVFD